MGMSKHLEACQALREGLVAPCIKHGGGHERKIAMLLALATDKVEVFWGGGWVHL